MKRYIIGLDEGTSSVRAMIYDTIERKIICAENKTFSQYFTQPGYVEQDADEIYRASVEVAENAVNKSGVNYDELYAIGITNQRETVVAWDRQTGEPLARAIVWQCNRTAARVSRIPRAYREVIRSKTGLIPDSYFSATKAEWLLKNNEAVKGAYKRGRLCIGTIDSYLSFRLCGKFVTDVSNASRTMLFNISSMEWDDELCSYFHVPKECLPQVVSSAEYIGETGICGGVPLCALIGDQQSALFGEACVRPGMAKNTYGTGCFLLMNIGDKPVLGSNKLLTTVAWRINGETTYALEGSVFHAGSAVDWLCGLGMCNVEQLSEMARSVENEGVYFVPAFSGLGAPYWDMTARAGLMGLTRGTRREHIARAVLESLAYSVQDLIQQMSEDAFSVVTLRADGGCSKNDFLMQFQADISALPIELPSELESTVMGAVYMAGLASGAFSDKSSIEELWQAKKRYMPNPLPDREELLDGWHKAVKRCLKWN